MPTQFEIAILCDNESCAPEFGSEWGLSMALTLADGALWLWDTGKTGLFLKNAVAMGIDVARAQGLALSHGHYDHTGGISALLAEGFTGTIHAHPTCASDRWSADPKGPRHIGPPTPLPTFVPAGPITKLAPGLTMITDIPREQGRFQAVQGFSYDRDGRQPDNVPDDAFLVLDTAQGPVAVLGCCHSGLANSLDCARDRLGIASFHAVLGGLHLYKADTNALEETADALHRHGVCLLVAGHCTGADRFQDLRGLLRGCKTEYMAAGRRYTFRA
ncbi:7,8-dihydropterin-6-yl-methyl-4-(beta-D-ribofuranosyl)aminobenzene 5'-phosphate synthase [Humidesulfovibrio mexicanus]|uniref:7,8-dihydropterin-6-yl-methyl-4-(Beta-D-ribofuranosyl)aminobenzene 5'-phosphate synthase n=1 Tax=Humidesulfovibrio mexicanus TaxID=147047 RepID=A0A238Z8G9_9BACT|nr:MBL fold metallo-hydrolase [Humidesulfovibrio mexicanus]SNR79044.1 7,8-dihydropterin-6-yl-methyl-4-(beta-D-ribofuranosyl)aminobenzene 5'-phosphate synthase [Humidesulfovibrio mexicanus]